ncbi:UNVERIFIED_CONTAM: hypothetical protein ABID98_004815 [Brevibacillus sp. OAP136]
MNRLTMKERPGLFLACLCVGLFFVFMDTAIVNVALTSIQNDLGALFLS